MFYVFDYEVNPEGSEILFRDDFLQPGLGPDWEVTGGRWKAGDGVLRGQNGEDRGALVYTNARFPGDVLLDFYGTAVPPCRNDLNFTWKARGWDAAKNDADIGYIGGLGGWWTGRAGIEKYPDCALRALTGSFCLEPGRAYHIQAGSILDYAFVAVDGQVLVELRDPQPLTGEDCARAGLGVYCSTIEFRRFRVLRPAWRHIRMAYAAAPAGAAEGKGNA